MSPTFGSIIFHICEIERENIGVIPSLFTRTEIAFFFLGQSWIGRSKRSDEGIGARGAAAGNKKQFTVGVTWKWIWIGKISFQTVRLNISLPEGLVPSIDEYARAPHMTRFGFWAKAAQDAMKS